MTADSQHQTTENQLIELREVCDRNDWEIVGEYSETISGAKGVNEHIELHRLLVNAQRGRFHKVVVWSVNSVGISMRHLLIVLSQLKDKDINVYSCKQGINISILDFLLNIAVPVYRNLKLAKTALMALRQNIYDYYYFKIKKKDIYVHQTEHYGIGNFINCTPAIIELSRHYKSKIDVLFDSDNVAKMYENCKYINIVNRDKVSNKHLLFDSSLINKEIEDWKFIHKLVARRLNIHANSIPHTYVDKVDYKPCHEKYCVIIRGGGPLSDEWLDLKDPGDNIYKSMIKTIGQSYKIVFVGADVDYQRFINKMEAWCDKPIVILNDMRKTLGALNNASFIITNDTGMYHASCALSVRTFVLWKDTWFVKNKGPGSSCTYSFEDRWSLEFNNWYKKIISKNVLYKQLDDD